MQPTPEVTDADVRRLAARDFGEANRDLVLSIVTEYGKQDWNHSSPRVWAAILKVSAGNLDQLLDWTKTAIEDDRDVLSAAEYPRYMREIGFSEVSFEMKKEVVDSDWKQYREWFERE